MRVTLQQSSLQADNWAPGQPDNSQSGQHCLANYFRGGRSSSRFWDDAACQASKQFICSYKPKFDCPAGWSEHRDSCYLVTNILSTWSSALAVCKVGSILTSFPSTSHLRLKTLQPAWSLSTPWRS